MMDALKKLYEELGFTDPDILSDYDNDILTENTINGRPVLWYSDSVKNVAIYTDTCDFLTAAELESF